MGSTKSVCFNCKKSFSLPPSDKCRECGGDLIIYPHRFRPPKKDNLNEWKVVRFLYENGFTYQHIIERVLINHKWATHYIDYPDNLIDAKDFVIKYKSQAIKL